MALVLWQNKWIILTAALLAALGVQTLRLNVAQSENDALEYQVNMAEMASRLRGVETGQRAVTELEEANDEQKDVVVRVVERVRNVCVRETDRIPVSPGPTRVAESSPADADAGDRAFALAVAVDLEMCAVELNKLRSLQRWVIANGG